jgi:hypothetical protein
VDLPLTGEILIALDLFRTYGGEIVRDMPVAVRLVEGTHGTDAKPVLARARIKHRNQILKLLGARKLWSVWQLAYRQGPSLV